MATIPGDAIPESEVLAFYHFLGRQIECGANEMTVEESVEAFRAHQRDTARLRRHLAPSIEQARRGDSKPLDADAIIERVASRSSQQGAAE